MSMIEENAEPRGRFAPSPTGEMHAGNIFSALIAWLMVKSRGGKMILRIEDLDRDRSKPAFADMIKTHLDQLGLTWDEEAPCQSLREEAYRDAFERLSANAHVYPCFCTRADLRAASAPHGVAGAIYDGRCASLTPQEVSQRMAVLGTLGKTASPRFPAFRLALPDESYGFEDAIQGPYTLNLSSDLGDPIIKRSDGGFAYQLAVVVDDAAQGIDSVVRGFDLLPSTPLQLHLQDLLGVNHPEYAHVPLLCAPDGRRLAKRNPECMYGALLQEHGSPEAVLGHIAFITGLISEDAPSTPHDLLAVFSMEGIASLWKDMERIIYR